MIRLQNVSKRLGKFHLEDINLLIPTGYICGLVGENGAGKTTLLNLMMGLYKPDTGKVLMNGKDYEDREKDIHNEMGVVLVEELFASKMTLMENANRYGHYYTGYSKDEMVRWLTDFNLDKDKKFGKLSKGEKLKCQFAFALACDVKLLILDEPTANFDPQFRQQFLTILKQFIEDGSRSVILATHLTEDLDQLADYLIYLEEGKQIFGGDIESFKDSYRMVFGENYKVKLLPKENIIHMEETSYGTKALVKNSGRNHYGEALEVTYPSIEEFMYYFSKREARKRR